MKKIVLFLQICFSIAILAILSACSNHFSTGTHQTSSVRVTSEPHHIALLLPVTGPLSPYASAIRNGFFAAFYEQKKQTGYAPTITIYDTNDKNTNAVYQRAVAQGADFIVGPLNKSAVEALAHHQNISTPVLALNTTTTPSVNHRVFEFALSPTDEAQQAAIRAWQDHHHNAIILAPNNIWGQRLVNAFTQTWQAEGGSIVGTQYYSGMTTLAKNIRTLLQISAENRDERQLKHMLHEKIRYLPQRRHDFDVIFLVATPSIARQVQPLLRFYFVNDVPIYSTSQVYLASHDRDLDGILFCDMPWILTPTQMQPTYLRTIQQTIQTTWPNNYNRLAKFYAMGVDAFSLTRDLKQLENGMPAATGTLYLSSSNQITRKLVWAKIENGVPVLLSSS